jgi:hypothetical protein
MDNTRSGHMRMVFGCVAIGLLVCLMVVFGVTAQEGDAIQARADELPVSLEPATIAAGFVVTPTYLETWEPDGVVTFQVSLTSQPTDTVLLPLETSNNQCELAGAGTLLWSPELWQDTKTVPVAAVADGVQDWDQICEVWTGPALSQDMDYNDLDPSDVTVLVKNSRYRLSLPVLVRNYWAGPWEAEPNDTIATANGPVQSDRVYYGTFPMASDLNDYYYFDLVTANTVEVWLTNIRTGHNYDLVLRNASSAIIGYSGMLGNNDEYINTGTALPPGRYYIQVYNRSSSGSSQAYHLFVVYE